MTKIQTALKQSLTKKSKLDIEKIPPFIGTILVDFLKAQLPMIPYESLLIDLNVKLAQVVSLNRMKVKTSQGETLVNYYGMVFMPSGRGKDRPLNLLDQTLMVPFTKKFEEQASNYRELEMIKVQEKAAKKFKSRASRDAYVERERPRWLVTTMKDATEEGFYAARHDLQRAWFGGTFVRINEFGDYISQTGGYHSTKGELLTSIVDVYEDGNSDPKIIKSEKDTVGIKGIPSNALFHTSLNGLVGGVDRLRLMKFLNRGGARRFFVAVPTLLRPKKPSMIAIKREIKLQESALKIQSKLKQQIKKTMKSLASKAVWKLDKKAEMLLRYYEKDAQYRIDQYNPISGEGIIACLTSLHRKALKYSGIVAAIEHPGEPVVKVEDLASAIYQSELYFNHFVRFYEMKETTSIEQLYHYFLQRRDQKKWITTMDIRKQRFIYKDKFKPWFNEAITESENLLMLKGYELEKEKFGGSGWKYRVIKISSKINAKE